MGTPLKYEWPFRFVWESADGTSRTLCGPLFRTFTMPFREPPPLEINFTRSRRQARFEPKFWKFGIGVPHSARGQINREIERIVSRYLFLFNSNALRFMKSLPRMCDFQS